MPAAQNMYIDWDQNSSGYDLIINSWYCSINTRKTYWAVHHWTNRGYAGFQNVSDTVLSDDNIIILAIWDQPPYSAAIEYYTNAADTNDFDFTEIGETGKHILSSVHWQDHTWYSMAVGVKSDAEFTYYFQWLKEELSSNWVLYAIIRLPQGGRTLHKIAAFQEDYGKTNQMRECYISNAFGRNSTNGTWESWDSGIVRSHNPNTNEWDTESNCDCGVGTYPDGEYVILRSGQGTGTSSELIPYSFQHNYQGTMPTSIPVFPCYIKSNYSHLYVSPNSNESYVVQKSARYWWNIVDAGNGYVYILTTDKTKAITISGTGCGDDLILTSFSNGSDPQKWKIIITSGVCHLYPKNNLNMNMDIEGPSCNVNERIQIWTHDSTTPQFKWTIC